MSEMEAERDAYRAMLCDLVAAQGRFALHEGSTMRLLARARELLKNGPVTPPCHAGDANDFGEGGQLGRGQTEPRATQKGAATPGQEATAQGAVSAAGNVAESQIGPTPDRADRSPSPGTLDLDAHEAVVRTAAAWNGGCGPWQWFGNMSSRDVSLATVHSGRTFVMDFDRWG